MRSNGKYVGTRAFSCMVVLFLTQVLLATSQPVERNRQLLPSDEKKLRSERSLRSDEEQQIKDALLKETLRQLYHHLRAADVEDSPFTRLFTRLLQKENRQTIGANRNLYSEVSRQAVNSPVSDVNNEEDEDEMQRLDRSYYGWFDFGKRSVDDDFTE